MYNEPIIRIAHLIGKKWTIATMQEVDINGDKGFNAILRNLNNISPKILSHRLRELQEKSFIKKRLITKKPIRTEYKLTKKGKELQKIIESIDSLDN